jgi:hypothetical protein
MARRTISGALASALNLLDRRRDLRGYRKLIEELQGHNRPRARTMAGRSRAHQVMLPISYQARNARGGR